MSSGCACETIYSYQSAPQWGSSLAESSADHQPVKSMVLFDIPKYFLQEDDEDMLALVAIEDNRKVMIFGDEIKQNLNDLEQRL